MRSATLPDRRSTCRHSLRVTPRLRIWRSLAPEQRAESVDLSARGALLQTGLPLRVGTDVELHLKLLEECTGEPTTEWRCRGRVVGIVPEIRPNCPSRVGVQFDWLDVSLLGEYS